jgi:hypothetical protein
MGRSNMQYWTNILGVFPKLIKATISFIISVRPPTRQILIKLNIWFFRKPVEKVQLSLKSDKNNGYFTGRLFYIYHSISLNYSQNENCSDENCNKTDNVRIT